MNFRSFAAVCLLVAMCCPAGGRVPWAAKGQAAAAQVVELRGDAGGRRFDGIGGDYLKWLRGLRDVYGLEFDAIGCRNEKGYSIEFAKTLRRTLDAGGFDKVRIHAFDHWPDHKFDFVKDLLTDAEARDAIDVIGADVYLNPGESAAVMGRVNHVGTGYGFIPKGYLLRLGADGRLDLVVVRGKVDKKALVGDAEQQALIKAGKDEGEGGEKVLASVKLPNVGPDRWYNLKLRFEGSAITGLLEGKPVISATDNLYPRGMAGLLAGGEKTKLSTPYFDNVLVKAANARAPRPSSAAPGQSPIYSAPGPRKRVPR